MTRVLVLMSEIETPTQVSIIQGEGLTVIAAQAMCLAAAQHFAALAMEEEIQRRLEKLESRE